MRGQRRTGLCHKTASNQVNKAYHLPAAIQSSQPANNQPALSLEPHCPASPKAYNTQRTATPAHSPLDQQRDETRDSNAKTDLADGCCKVCKLLLQWCVLAACVAD